MNFMEELLLEAEKAEENQRIEMDRLRADQLLMTIEKLESQADELNKMVNSEISLIEDYHKIEGERINKKIRWLAWNLEQFIKSTDEKTIRLPHGTVKLRTGRDKVEVEDLERFLANEENQIFLKTIPETYKPDLLMVMDHIKQTGHIPNGVKYVNGGVRFSFTTQKRSKENDNSSE